MMLNADVRKGGGGWSNADRGEGVMKRGHFCGRPLWTTPMVYSCVTAGAVIAGSNIIILRIVCTLL